MFWRVLSFIDRIPFRNTLWFDKPKIIPEKSSNMLTHRLPNCHSRQSHSLSISISRSIHSIVISYIILKLMNFSIHWWHLNDNWTTMGGVSARWKWNYFFSIFKWEKLKVSCYIDLSWTHIRNLLYSEHMCSKFHANIHIISTKTWHSKTGHNLLVLAEILRNNDRLLI